MASIPLSTETPTSTTLAASATSATSATSEWRSTKLMPSTVTSSPPRVSFDPNWGSTGPGTARGGPPETWVIVVAIMGGLIGLGIIVGLLTYCGKDKRNRTEYRSYGHYGFPTTVAAPPPYSRFDEEAGVVRPPTSHPRRDRIHRAAHNRHMDMHNQHLAAHHTAHNTAMSAHNTAMRSGGAF